jgi:signal peptidase II
MKISKKETGKTVLSFALAFALAGFDQGIKHYIRQLPEDCFPFPLGSFATCWQAFNPGASFSSLSRFSDYIVVFSVVSTAWITFYLMFAQKRLADRLVGAVIYGGVLGNTIDRVFQGAVTDYLSINVYPVVIFNFADICIVLGVPAFLFLIFFLEDS